MSAEQNQIIKNLLESNKVDDLKRFLNRRSCLNSTNICLIYLFHFVQTAGILTTTVAAGYDLKEIIWIGASLNALATLIHVFEKINDGLLKQYEKDIQLIRSGNYIDESHITMDDNVSNGSSQK